MQRASLALALLALFTSVAEGLQEAHDQEKVQLLIDQDITLMEDKHFLDFDPKKGVVDNIKAAFHHFLASSTLQQELTEEEMELFEQRVIDEQKTEEQKDSS